MGKLTDPMFDNVPPDNTVTPVFNLPPPPVNPTDERPAEAKLKSRTNDASPN